MAKKGDSKVTYGRVDRSIKSKPASLIARWVEAEALEQKLLGISFAKIADCIGRAARREVASATPLPPVEFPPDYKISEQAVAKAYHRALTRTSKSPAEEYRDLDTMRAEEWILALQKGIQAGNTAAIRAGTHLLNFRMVAQGYAATKKVKDNGRVKPEDEDDQLSETHEYRIELARVMTDEERDTIAEIFDRARVRLAAKQNGQPAIVATAAIEAPRYDREDD